MTSVHIVHSLAAITVLGLLPVTMQPVHAQTPRSPIAIASATVSLAGTSNVHDYTASTTQVTLTRVAVGDDQATPLSWEEVQKSGGLVAFDIAIPAATLSCPRDGVDKNMHKALKVESHPNITFSMKRLEGTPGALKAIGILRIAGVEREVTLPLATAVKGDHLAVTGAVDVQMPDYGIKPPTAMLGVVRASPKVSVTFELLLAPGTT